MVTITMLGLHKSGKTTYMGMMFNRFMDRATVIAINGHNNVIKIVPTSLDERTKIANWRHNNETDCLIEGRFSGATGKNKDNVCSFNFYLKANEQTLSEFKFTDYPGEALEDILLKPHDNDYNNLAKTIYNSDAVIIFVDAVKLFMYKSVEAAGIALGCSHLNNAIARAAHIDGYGNETSTNDKKKLHIIFALTKCDADIFKPDTDYGLEEKLQQVFNGIFHEYETSVFRVMSIGSSAIKSDIKFKEDGSLQNDHTILRGDGYEFAPENIVSILIDALAKCNETRKEQLINDKQRTIIEQSIHEKDLQDMSGVEKFLLRKKYHEKQAQLEECVRKIGEIDKQLSACDKYKDVFAEIIKQKL